MDCSTRLIAFFRAGLALFLFLCALCGRVDAQTIGNGETVTGSVTGTGAQSWTFSGTAGNYTVCAGVTTTGTISTQFVPTVSIYNPDGTALHGAYSDGLGARACWSVLPQSGTYTVTVRNYWGSSYPSQVGTFLLNLVLSLQPDVVANTNSGGLASPGVTGNGSITGATVDLWSFAAASGDTVTVSMTYGGSDSNFEPWITIYGPDGVDVAGNYGSPTAARSFVASETGTFLVFAGNANPDAGDTGAYTFTASGMSVLPTFAKTSGSPKKSTTGKILCGCAGGGDAEPSAGSVGDPITISSGNMFEPVIDYSTVGPNPLAFIRYYNSQGVQAQTHPTALGPNWRSNYDRYLRLFTSTLVSAERPDGQVLNFTYNGGVWVADSDIDVTLTDTGSNWTLTDSDDTVETYTASGSLATLDTIKLRNGYTQTLNYTSGVLTSIADSYSRSLTLSYTSGLLTGVKTPDSIAFTYVYTAVAANDRLTSVSYNTSPVTSQTYLYENASLPYALTGITDELGNRYATWSYDNLGRTTSSQLGGTLAANLTTISYDASTGNRTVTGPLGIAETYKFTTYQGIPKVTEIDRAENGTVTAATRLFTYDSNGYLASATDWSTNSTHYTNNSHGLPTQTVEASGSSVARTTAIVYDTTWARLPHTITTTGTATTLNYDTSTGNLLTKVLADTTTQTVPYSTKGQSRTWTYTYTATGQLHTVHLPRTDVTAKTTYNYTGGTLTSIVDPLSHTTTINTYTNGGRPLTVTDPNSVLTTLAYDARLNLHTKVVTISGGSLTTTWTHDAANDLTELMQSDSTYLSYAYDTAHRLHKITNAKDELIPLTLDAAGDVKQILWQTATTPTTKRTHTATFDALGRKLTDVGGMSQKTTYGYDSQNNLISIETPLTWSTGQTPDALNRIKTITDPYSHTTGTTFDAHDRPLTVTDPNGHATTYIYNGFGEAISVASPDSGTTVYHYDFDGNVSSKTDAASQVTNWTYDAMDRPLTRAYPADSTLNVAYTYDQNGHGKGVTKLTSLTDQAGSLSLTYDESGNVLTNARAVSSTTYTTTYTYNGQRTIATITYPTAGWIATYARDVAGQVTGITTTQPSHSAVSLVSSVTHLPFGPVASFSWGNGVTHSTTFDADYRQTGLTDTGTAALQSLTYNYDADNNLYTITDAVTAANSQTLTYDHLERLMGAASSSGGYGTLSYTYDNNGNRKTDTGTTYAIATSSNQLTAIGSTNVSYFGTGNINAIGTASLTYNKANQLATVSANGSSGTYSYDAFGQRLKAQPPSVPLQVYNYDLSGNLLTETDNNIEFDYIYLDGTPIAVIEPSTAAISYIQADRLGTPQLATNSSKANVWHAFYKPFGQTTSITGSITQNLRLPGQYADNTGYSHNGFRNYNPAIGRYLESDPIGLNGGTTDTYAYAGSNPHRWTDLNGLQVSPFGDGSINPFLQQQQEHQVLQNSASNAASNLESFAKLTGSAGATLTLFGVQPAGAILGTTALCSGALSLAIDPTPLKAFDSLADLVAESLGVGPQYTIIMNGGGEVFKVQGAQ